MKKLSLLTGIGLIGWSILSSAQPGEHAQQMFDSLDTSGDGSISFEEFLKNGRNPVERLDSDADGLVSLEEFLAGKPEGRRPGRKRKGRGQSDRPDPTAEQVPKTQAKMQERGMTKFEEMDLDGDGLLSALEISEATFLQMDADGNGVLSVAELKSPRRAGRGECGDRRGRPGTDCGGQSDQI
jgi:hypothetical protein